MISVGIDIGRFSIKMAEVEVTSKGYNLVQTKEFPLNQDPTRDQRLDIVEALRAISSAYDPQSTKFVFGVPQGNVAVRRREFPFRERHKVLKSVAFELEDDIPFNQETAIFDARITHFVGNTSEVLAIACLKEVIQGFTQVAHDGSLEVDILSVQGFALSNLFEDSLGSPTEEEAIDQPIPEPSEAEIIIDIGHETTTLIVMKEDYLLDMRTIDWGGKNLAQALSSKYKMHYLEALKELRKKAFILVSDQGATQEQIGFSNHLKTVVDELAHEIGLCLIDLKSEYHLHFRSVGILGGVSQLKGLGPYLTQKLELPANRLHRLLHHPALDFATNSFHETTHAVAIGLAIEGAKKPKNPAINLMKGEFARQSEALKMFWQKWGHSLQVAAAMFAVLIVYGVLRDNMAQTIADQAHEQLSVQAKNIAGLPRTKANARNARKFIRKQKKLEKNMAMAADLKKLNSSLDVLKLISSATPGANIAELNIFRMIINNDSVMIEGETSKARSIERLQKSFQGLSKNGKVNKLTTQYKAQPGWTTFAFRFITNRKNGG